MRYLFVFFLCNYTFSGITTKFIDNLTNHGVNFKEYESLSLGELLFRAESIAEINKESCRFQPMCGNPKIDDILPGELITKSTEEISLYGNILFYAYPDLAFLDQVQNFSELTVDKVNSLSLGNIAYLVLRSEQTIIKDIAKNLLSSYKKCANDRILLNFHDLDICNKITSTLEARKK